MTGWIYLSMELSQGVVPCLEQHTQLVAEALIFQFACFLLFSQETVLLQSSVKRPQGHPY